MSRSNADKEKQHRDRIRAQAKKYGIKSVGIKFSDLETRVFAMMESRRKKAVEALDTRAQKRFEAALEESYRLVPEDEVDAILVDMSRQGLNGRDFWNQATSLMRGLSEDAVAQKAQEKINAATENAEWLKDGNGRGNQPTSSGNQDQPSNPASPGEEFSLAGQSAAEIARQEAERLATEQKAQAEAAQEAADKVAAEKQSIADKIKARAENPDNFQFGEGAKAAANPMGGLSEQPASPPSNSTAGETVSQQNPYGLASTRGFESLENRAGLSGP